MDLTDPDELPVAEGILVDPPPETFSSTDVELVLALFKTPLSSPGATAGQTLVTYQDKARTVALYRQKFTAPLERRIQELERLLFEAGICPDCGKEISHDMEQPLASCPCDRCTGECTIIPTIAGLRYEIYNLTYCNPHLKKITDHVFRGTTAICLDPSIVSDQVTGEFDRLNAALEVENRALRDALAAEKARADGMEAANRALRDALEAAVSNHELHCDLASRLGFEKPVGATWLPSARKALVPAAPAKEGL